MNGAKRSAEAVGCKNESVGERSALEKSTLGFDEKKNNHASRVGRKDNNHATRVGRSGSENVGLSNENIGENPMPRKPKDSSGRFVHGG